MTFHIISLFPEAFESYLKSSILGRAIKKHLIKIHFYQPRKYARDKHKMVDDRPYAGGAGMVMKAEPILCAVESIIKKNKQKKTKIVLLSVAGKRFSNMLATSWSKIDHTILIAGRYEGIDARVSAMLKNISKGKKNITVEEISIGPYIVMGGELPALIIVDAVARHVAGVLGKRESLEEVRFKHMIKKIGKFSHTTKTPSLPVYTRPEVIEYKGKKYHVPKVLVSGDHKKINMWKKEHMKYV